jgi:Protein of unknown function (DUF4230)
MQRRTVFVTLGVIALLVAFSAATAAIVWRMAKRTVVEQILTPKETTVDITALVTQVRELHRLETASMRVVHVGTVRQSYKMVPNALTGDELTFLATGDVIAGVDLAQLQPTDVWRSADGAINVRLPPPQILVTRVDNKESRVITRKTGVLRRADVGLETRARQHAEENIRAEAIKKGILPMARDNSEKKMAEFLRTLGFMRVRFHESAAPPSR